MFCWKVISGFRDIHISVQGSICVENQLSSGFYEFWQQNKFWKEKYRWDYAAIKYLNNFYKPSEKATALEAIRNNCSDYVYVAKTFTQSTKNPDKYDEGEALVVDNWALWDNDPASPNDRKESMIFWAIIMFISFIDFRRLKIFIWSKDS